MSTLATVHAARETAGQPGTTHSRPAAHTSRHPNSAPHSEIATRPKSGGACTVGKNRNAPNDSNSVRAITTSTPSMLPQPSTRGRVRPTRMSMFRLCLVVAAVATLTAAPSASAATTRANWNLEQQEDVAAAGVLPRLSDGRFHGDRPLTGAQLSGALGALTGQPTAASSAATVSVTEFDARLVRHLGLADVAAHVQSVARRAGLNPPRYFGTEVVARQMGLRTNHPFAHDALELYPWEPITRAEAAHSLATAMDNEWAAEHARAQLSAFDLPRYTGQTKRALRVAASKIGMPYIWGGETDRTSSFYGYQAHGGYDCSGFVWRTFKLSDHPAGRGIGGRTAAQMAGEIRKRARLRLEEARPGDLLFFGSAGFGSKATEAGVDHVGIALSAHWMIHASAQGVYVSSLDEEWRQDRFTWARRVL